MDRETWLRSKRSSKWTIVGNEPILSAERDPSMTIGDCRVKDELVTKYENIAREALEGQSKAEERGLLIKRELDEAVAAKVAADERLNLVEAALASSVEQLNALEDEMEGKIRDAVVKGTTVFFERQVEFEENLNEATADFVNLSVENSRLVAEISAKDKMIKDLDRRRCMTESELDVVVTRLDGIEKENAFLRYEFQLMEKELAMRNEQLEYCNQLAEGLHKKHLQGLNKVAKLEVECQRLRVQSQKRVMQLAMTRIPNSTSHVTERLRMLEDENKMLKEVILMMDSELEKARDGDSSDGQYLKMPRYEFDVCKDCSSSESWANALILGLKNFQKEGLQSTFSHGSERSPKSSPESNLLGAEKLNVVPLEIAPSSKGKSSSGSMNSSVNWLQVVLDAIAEERRISERDLEDLLLDVGIALGFSYSCKNTRQMSQFGTSGKYDVAGLLPWKARLTKKMGNGDEIDTTETAKTELEERLDNAQQQIYQMNDEAVGLKESKRLLEDQIEHQKLVNQDLETQLTVTRNELNEVMQQYYSLEVELEDQNHRCEELESTCIELELQLGSVVTEPSDYDGVIQGLTTLSQDGGEEKFAACKDTILDITKQPKTPPSLLKESASGRASSDRSTVIASRGSNNRPSLHARMLADGFAELKAVVVPHSTEIPNRRNDDALFISYAAIRTPEMIQKYSAKTAAGPPATATSPRKRNGGAGFGFVRKLMIKSNRERQAGIDDA